MLDMAEMREESFVPVAPVRTEPDLAAALAGAADGVSEPRRGSAVAASVPNCSTR